MTVYEVISMSQSIELALQPAQHSFDTFLRSVASTERVVIFCHFDADGLAAGALLARALPRLGFQQVQVVVSGRGESAFSEGARERLALLRPAALIVTDLGVHQDGVLPDVPTLYIDHHQPHGEPRDATIISGYDWEPIPNSAWMVYDLLAPFTPIEDLAWIAAVGTLSDLGDKAPWPELPAVKKQVTGKWLKEAVALINAARRAPAFDVQTPLQMLLQANHPRAISEDEVLGADRLRAYRAEVNAALQEARKQAPVFSATTPFALLHLDSNCQIHPLIAQQWRTRLPKYAVMAANRGYLPEVVAFSVRTARADLNLPQLLQAVELHGHHTSFGYGHDQASGGHLPFAVFNRLLDGLGFDERAHV
jgi:single-stranded-DNA-specific exonuclease